LPAETADRGEIAFAVELHADDKTAAATQVPPAPPSPKAMPAELVTVTTASDALAQVGPKDSPPSSAVREDRELVEPSSATDGDANRASTGERERKPAAPERISRPDVAVDPHVEAPAVTPGGRVANHWAQPGAVRQEAPAEPAATPEPSPVRGMETATRADGKAENQPLSAHDIKLEVAGGEQRVDVRISERGGEVRVAVRTPDSHMAGALRESLPELATRFAETGLRSEIWRPGGSSSGEWRHAAETPAGNLAQDAEAQSRHNGDPQDSPQREQADSQQQKNQKEKGKDFAWLMSSLR
jgi:hypothetical protein